MVYVIAGVILLAGLYSVAIVGITGGPNNGEHPLLVTLVHLGIFHFTTDSWPSALRDMYFWVLMLCLAASIVGFGNSDCAKHKSRFWVAQVMLGVSYITFVLLYLSVHGGI